MGAVEREVVHVEREGGKSRKVRWESNMRGYIHFEWYVLYSEDQGEYM